MTFPAADPFDDVPYRRRKRPPRWIGPAILGLIVLGVVALLVLRGPQIGVRANDQKVISVVLPPPPPPPPPPPVEPKPPEPKPEITPPKPTPETPPPPTQAPPQAAPDASALTAREGAGPSNYGLQQGNGGGTRIGGPPASNAGAFLAYADVAMADIRRTAQADPKLAGRYSVKIAVQVDADGHIVNLRILGGSGDLKRDAELQQRLAGLQLSKRPPDGLPVMRIQLDTGPGA